MPTTFNVISLGVQADMDTIEGNASAENASSLVGLTFGSAGDALVNDVQEFSQGSTGFTGGTATAYDQDNGPSETFRINGGADQTFDSTAVFNATITYLDGTTATITAVIFQDTAGNTYMSPEFSSNADQAALEAGGIRSLTLDSLLGNFYSGMNATRETFNFVTCFTTGAQIATPKGERPVEQLSVGDLVTTQDRGAQPIRWIGKRTCNGQGAFQPVRIAKGALGQGLPRRDLVVSQQHRMLVRSKIAGRLFASPEILVPAKKLLGMPGVSLDEVTQVTYYHLLFDHHEILFAENAPTESLYLGPMTKKSMHANAWREITALFPKVAEEGVKAVRTLAKGKRVKSLVERHLKNTQPLLSA